MKTQADTDEVDDLATLEVLDEVRNKTLDYSTVQRIFNNFHETGETVTDLLDRRRSSLHFKTELGPLKMTFFPQNCNSLISEF